MAVTFKFSPTSRDGLELAYEEEKKKNEQAAAPVILAPQAAAKKQPALNALTNAGLIQKEGNPVLDDRQLRTLLGMDAVKNKDGGFDLYGKNGTEPAMTVTKDGDVGVASRGAMDSAESIDAVMEGVQMYKTLHPGQSCYLSGGDEKGVVMAAYIAEKAGLKVWTQTGKKLDDLAKTDPQYAELKKKIDAEWDKKNGPAPAQSPPGVTMTPAPAAVPVADPQSASMKFNDPKAYPTSTYTMDGARAVIGKVDGEFRTKTYAFDETTMANSKIAQFLNGKNANDIDTGALKNYVDGLKDGGYEFTAHDKALVKGLQGEIAPIAQQGHIHHDYGPGPVGIAPHVFEEEREINRGIDAARSNWRGLEDISKTIGNPPDPNADKIPSGYKLSDLLVEKPSWHTVPQISPILEDPKRFETLKRYLEENPDWDKPSKSIEKMLGEKIVWGEAPDRLHGQPLNKEWGEIPDISRSGLKSPVADGLCQKFEGCATGADLSGDPAQRRTLVADIDLQQRTKPALGGLANG